MHCGYIHYHVNPLSSDEAWQQQWHFLILQASDWVLHQIWPCEWGCSPFQSTGQDTWIHVLSVQWGPWSREWPAFSLSPSSLFRRYVPHWSQLQPCMFVSIAGDEAWAMCSWVCGIEMWSALCRKSIAVVGDFGSHGQGQPTNSQKGNADKQEGPYIGQLLDWTLAAGGRPRLWDWLCCEVS